MGNLKVWKHGLTSKTTCGITNGVRAHRRLGGNIDAFGNTISSTEAVVLPDDSEEGVVLRARG